MRLISFLIILSIFCLSTNFGLGQNSKQHESSIVKRKYIGEYTTLFPVINLDMFEHTEGLPRTQGKIKTMLQSTDGFLWISVINYGLFRYDGYQFRSFAFDKNDSTGIPAKFIMDIIPSANKGLWLVTDKGLMWFDLKTYRSKIIKKIPQQLFETIHGWSCVEDKTGKLWIFGHGLYLYDPSSYRIEKISDSLALNVANNQRISIANYFFQNNYSRPKLSPDGSLWLAANAKLVQIDPASKAITCYPIPWGSTYYTAIGVLPDPDSSHIWISFSDRIGRFNLKKQSWLFMDFKKNDLIKYSEAYFMSHIEDDKLWLANGNSITILDTRSFNAQLFKGDQKWAGNIKMSCGLYGVRWIWDEKDRLFCNITESKRFTYFKILPPDEKVLSYWKDKENSIEWFGAITGDGTPSLYRYDVRNRNASRFKIPAEKSSLVNIYQFNATELLVSVFPIEAGTATQTFFRFNMVSLSFRPFQNSLVLDNVSSIFRRREIIRDNENNLWLNNLSKLLKYDSLKDSFYVWNDNEGFIGITPSADRDFFWAGGKYLYKVYTKEHKIEKLQPFFQGGANYPLIEDRKGNVLLSVNGSPAFYNPSTREISTIPGVSFIIHPMIDSNNNLFGITQNGLLFYNTATKETKFYNEKDGFELATANVVRNIDNNELLIDDCYRIPLSFFYTKNKTPLQFLSIKSSGKELSPVEYADSSASIVLDHDENSVSIEFAYLNFLPNRYNRYVCTMVGLDTVWHQLGAKNSINYMNLAPGPYTFRIKAIDKDGMLIQEKVLRIEIVPSFRQTIWFKILLIILSILFIGTVLYWIHRNRMHKLGLKFELEQERIRQQQKELEFEKRLADLTLSALRSQINPHFIFNCLNSIKLYATENDIGAATDYLSKFSRLIRQVLDNSMNDQISLSSELEVLELYIGMEAMRFKEKLRYRINIDKAVDVEYIEIPPLLLQPYVENAIWHGLMPKDEGGNLEISVGMKDKDTLLIRIKDDGIGRAKAADLKSRVNAQHKPFGMKITSERMNLIIRKYNRPMSIVIHDLKDASGEPAGTLVTIQIEIK